MTRVKGGVVSKNRRRKVLKRAKGYFGSKHRLYKTAQEQLFHSGAYRVLSDNSAKRKYDRIWYSHVGKKIDKQEREKRPDILSLLFGINKQSKNLKNANKKVAIKGENVETHPHDNNKHKKLS